MARLLEFPIPTMCVFNGSAIAGGYLLGICHDARIMNEAVGLICLSEMQYGIALNRPMMLVIKSKLGHSKCLQLAMSVTFSPENALRDGLIDYTYSTMENLEDQLKTHMKRYAPLGANR